MKLESLLTTVAPRPTPSPDARPATGAPLRTAVFAAFLLLALTAPVPVHAEPRASDAVVARVAAGVITADEFRARFAEYLVRTGLSDSGALRQRFLNGLIETRLLAAEAVSEGMNDSPAYRHAEERLRRKLLLDLFVRRTLYDAIVVTEADLEEAFRRINTTLEARHLYARSLDEANALRARLESGARWEDLARTTFADSALSASGGYLGRFTFDEMDADFEDAAFALEVGEISRPVRTAHGYSIIQLLSRETKPLMTEQEFAARRDVLETYVVNRKRDAAKRAEARRLAEALELEFDEQSLGELLGQVSGEVLATGDEAYRAWLARPLLRFTLDGRRQSWSIAAFREQAGYTDEAQRAQVGSLEDLTDFAEGVVVREVMLNRARSIGLDEDPSMKPALDAAMIAWMAGAARQNLMTQLPDSTAGSAYRNHIASLRARFDVRVHRDVLAAVPLIEPASP